MRRGVEIARGEVSSDLLFFVSSSEEIKKFFALFNFFVYFLSFVYFVFLVRAHTNKKYHGLIHVMWRSICGHHLETRTNVEDHLPALHRSRLHRPIK